MNAPANELSTGLMSFICQPDSADKHGMQIVKN